uniref:Acyl-CoA-delta11-2-desaturase n=1 Tax=Dendrolimus punctatus TaxID=238572 RepID=B7SB74_9NEOP|nr:acyl-CoA-delta11-2-desaturase [Dendrolimus punctatus]ACS69071.1 acyl-CoA-delta11-2-desaturase [Dendrolimus punctatus]
MPPNTETFKKLKISEENLEQFPKLVAPQAAPRKYEIIYINVLTFSYWHLAAFYGIYLCFTSAKWTSVFFVFLYCTMGEVGVTAGSHRLWSHKSYKAKLPLQIILMTLSSIAFQNSVIDWVRNHRTHHKYSDTDADPHNATRGFFFSHIGWLLVRKHSQTKLRGKTIDMSDIYNNSVLRFQKKYAIPFIGTICFVLPVLIPMYCWNESFINAWHLNMLRYCLSLNFTFLVNSAAHLYGNKPYDKNILPAENKAVSFLTLGEGFHNYHHTFPWDYRAAELGNNKLNLTTKFIDFFAWVGWAYDMKTVSDDMIRSRAKRTGDGSIIWDDGKETIEMGDVSDAIVIKNE